MKSGDSDNDTSATLNRPPESETYSAFGGKDRVERLEIRRAMEPFRAPRYLLLDDIAFDGFYGTNFVLVFSSMLVLVEGRNLQPLVAALKNSTVDFIQEYHPDLWEQPTHEDALITSIQIVLKGLDQEAKK